MKKILLAAPAMPGPRGDFVLNRSFGEEEMRLLGSRWRVTTPALILLAAIAEQEGYEPETADEAFRSLPQGPYDVVSLYTVTPNARRAYALADEYRRRGAHVVIGGVHAKAMPKEAARHADTLMIGEGELIFRRFLRDFARGHPEKCYEQPVGTVNLCASPVPLFSLLSEEERKLIPVQSSRGCSNRCSFCNVRGLYGDALREKNAEQLGRELRAIEGLRGTGRIYITDDNIYSDPAHFHMLTGVMRESGFSWYANADISFAAERDNIREARRSGLSQVLIGFEGIRRDLLERVEPGGLKARYADRYDEMIQRIQDEGIGVTGSFIVGWPDDQPQVFERLEEFISRTGLFAASITMATPYPGTPLFERMHRSRRLASYDWNDYTIYQPVMRHDCLSEEELNRKYCLLLSRLSSPDTVREKIRKFTEGFKVRAEKDETGPAMKKDES